jgi:aminoglycoside phosphotransferase (APT) family kinase protein
MSLDDPVGLGHHVRVGDRRLLIADALGVAPRTIVEVDAGYDFVVAIVDDAWVFRFPRRAGVEAPLRLEISLLPELASARPVEVPSFEYISRDPLFVGYPLIRGEPLRDEDPDGVRAFLEALHSFDPSGLPVEHHDWVGAYRQQCAEFERLVFPILDRETRAKAKDLFSEVETLVGFMPVLLHADLGAEHLLVREGRLTGVIDWGDARIGDPALDYAWLLNDPFTGWDVDPDVRRRARFYQRLAPWYEAHYGLFTGQPAHVEVGVAGIKGRL